MPRPLRGRGAGRPARGGPCRPGRGRHGARGPCAPWRRRRSPSRGSSASMTGHGGEGAPTARSSSGRSAAVRSPFGPTGRPGPWPPGSRPIRASRWSPAIALAPAACGVRRGAPEAQQVADRRHPPRATRRCAGGRPRTPSPRSRRHPCGRGRGRLRGNDPSSSSADTALDPATSSRETGEPHPCRPTGALPGDEGTTRSGLEPDPDLRGARARPQDRAPMAARRPSAEPGQAGAGRHHRALRGLSGVVCGWPRWCKGFREGRRLSTACSRVSGLGVRLLRGRGPGWSVRRSGPHRLRGL